MTALFARIVLFVLLAGLCLPPTGGQAETFPEPADRDRCPVCGMFVLPHPNWLASAVFADGSRYFFDGPKDLFKFLAEPSKYAPATAGVPLETCQVTEYYTLQRVNAEDVFFVTGSDVLGPMGTELVPVAGAEALKTFIRDHGHEQILRFTGRDLEPAAPLP